MFAPVFFVITRIAVIVIQIVPARIGTKPPGPSPRAPFWTGCGRAWGERGEGDAPVSYTHLDVYKRQLLYLSGGIQLGDLSSFVQYSRKFSGPINEVANIVGELQSAFAAAEHL